MADTTVLTDLLQTLEDGQRGFESGADKLEKDGRPVIARAFRELSAQRAEFATELRRAQPNGEKIAAGGSVAGSLHPGWLALKDALAGDDPHGVLDAAEQGEDHAKGVFGRALEDAAFSADVRTIVSRQRDEISAAHDRVRALRGCCRGVVRPALTGRGSVPDGSRYRFGAGSVEVP